MITDMVNFGFSFRADKERALSSSWASGNGGARETTCDCDGYTDRHLHHLHQQCLAKQGLSPGTQRSVPSTLATPHSSGDYTDQRIVSCFLSASLCLGRRARFASKGSLGQMDLLKLPLSVGETHTLLT